MGLPANLRQSAQKRLPLLVGGEDTLLVVTSIHDMVDSPRILDVQIARHIQYMRSTTHVIQGPLVYILIDPFSPVTIWLSITIPVRQRFNFRTETQACCIGPTTN
jgi:hypothetical protein